MSFRRTQLVSQEADAMLHLLFNSLRGSPFAEMFSYIEDSSSLLCAVELIPFQVDTLRGELK